MDAAVGDGVKYSGFSWLTFVAKKMGDLTVPGPSDSWVFTDEHPDSIDDFGITASMPIFSLCRCSACRRRSGSQAGS
jgi:hypothetical protein